MVGAIALGGLLAVWWRLDTRTRREAAAKPTAIEHHETWDGVRRGALSKQVAAANPRGTARDDPAASDEIGFLAGRVTLADGRPAYGAEVMAVGTEAIAVAGTDGAFLIDVKSGDQRLTARLGNDVGTMPTSITVASGETIDGIVIRLAAAARFEGTVISDTGAPVAGARVVAGIALSGYGGPRRGGGAPVGSANTDISGRFNLDGLAPAVYTIRASAPGFVDAEEFNLAIEAGQRFMVPLRMTRLGAIEGTVTDAAGRPISQAVVSTWDWHGQRLEARSNGDGHYRMEGARADRISVSAGHGDAAGHVTKVVDVSPGAVAQADFVLPKPGAVTGIVTMPDGAPASPAVINFYSKARYDEAGQVTTDSTGHYRAVLLPGRYDVSCAMGSMGARSKTEIRSSDTTELNLTLAEQHEEKSPSITGVVLETTGAPLGGAWVGTRGSAFDDFIVFTAGLERGSALTGADGRFEIHPFRKEEAVAVVARAGGRFGSVQGVRPGADVVVQLQRSATVVGHVIGLSSTSFEALVQPREAAGPSESSSWLRFTGDQFTIADLAPVPSILRVRESGKSASVDLALEPGETKEVDARLAEETPVAGAVVDSGTGKPIEDAWVMATGETYSNKVSSGGKFVVMLSSGSHTIDVWAAGYKSRDLPVVLAGDSLNLGDIALDGNPIGGVGIWWAQAGSSQSLVDHVSQGGPAAQAGLRAGDVVIAVNGELVESAGDASNLIRGPIGSPVTITIRRNGTELTAQMVRVDLGKLTANSR